MKKRPPSVIAIDFDESLALYNPKTKLKTYVVKKINSLPNPRMIRYIKNMRQQGNRVIVYSSRWWGDYNAVNDWLKKYNVQVDGVVLGRLKADVYVCDKSVNAHDIHFETVSQRLLNETDSWGKWFKEYYSKRK